MLASERGSEPGPATTMQLVGKNLETGGPQATRTIAGPCGTLRGSYPCGCGFDSRPRYHLAGPRQKAWSSTPCAVSLSATLAGDLIHPEPPPGDDPRSGRIQERTVRPPRPRGRNHGVVTCASGPERGSVRRGVAVPTTARTHDQGRERCPGQRARPTAPTFRRSAQRPDGPLEVLRARTRTGVGVTLAVRRLPVPGLFLQRP